MKCTEKQLGRCHATVKHLEECDVYIQYIGDSGLVHEHKYDADSVDVYVLESYISDVAIIVRTSSRDYFYSLPRHKFSVTTQKQVQRFLSEYMTYTPKQPREFNTALCYKVDINPWKAW